MPEHPAFKALCVAAASRQLHVELYTDHRSKNARDAKEREPQINELAITDSNRRVIHRVPTSMRNLDIHAGQLLSAIGAR